MRKQKQPPTNMYDMACGVNHDVAVVTIFDLQQKANDAVCCHGHDEVVTGLFICVTENISFM